MNKERRSAQTSTTAHEHYKSITRAGRACFGDERGGNVFGAVSVTGLGCLFRLALGVGEAWVASGTGVGWLRLQASVTAGVQDRLWFWWM